MSDQPDPQVMKLRLRCEVLLEMLTEQRAAVAELVRRVGERDAQIAELLTQSAAQAEVAE